MEKRALWVDGAWDHDFEQERGYPLRHSAQRRTGGLQESKQRGHAQRPLLRLAHGQGLGQDFAADQNDGNQADDNHKGRPMAVERHPQRGGQHGGAGEGVAQDHSGQQFLRFGQQAQDDAASPWLAGGQLARLPFAERKEGRLGEREKEACPREDQHHNCGC